MEGTEKTPEGSTEPRSVSENRPPLTSGETTDLQLSGSQTLDAMNSDIQVASHADKCEEHQPEYSESKKKTLEDFDFRQNEIPVDVEEASVITMDIGELNCNIKCKPQNESDVEFATVKPPSLKNGGENETPTAFSPELQTSPVVQNSSNLPSIHSLEETATEEPCDAIEESNVKEPKDPKIKEAHPEEISDAVLQSSDGKNGFDGDTQSQAVRENEPVEPTAKKKPRKRMGMCGLGDRKRRFPFDGQQYRHSCISKERGKGVGTVDNDNTDGLIGGTREEIENTVLSPDDGSTEQLNNFKDQKSQDTSEWHVPPNEQDLDEGLDQPSTVMLNNHETKNASRNDDPIQFATLTDNEPSLKKVVSEEKELHADHKLIECSVEVPKDVIEDLFEASKNLIFDSIGVPNEPIEGMMEVTLEDQDLTDLEEMEMGITEFCPSDVIRNVDDINLSPTAKEDLSTKDGMDPLFLEHVVTVPTPPSESRATSPDVRSKKDQSVRMDLQLPTTSVSEREQSNSSLDEMAAAPPTDQESHNQFCDPTMTSADTDLHQEPDASVPSSPFCSVTDSQLNDIALIMELEGQSVPGGPEHSEDGTIISGLIKELSFLNRTVMAAHREMELMRLGNRPPKLPIRRK